MSQSIIKTISEGVVWTSVGSVATKVIGIVYIAIVLTHLSLYEYGVVELLLSIPPLLGFLNLPGLELAVIADMGYEKGRSNIKRMRYIYTSYMSVRIILGIVGWVILFFAAPFVAVYYNGEIANMIRIISFTFLLSPLRTSFQIIFKTGLQFKFLAVYSFMEEFGKLIVLSTALLVFNAGPTSVVIAYVGADVVALATCFLFYIATKKKLFQGNMSLSGLRDPFCIIKAHGKWSILASYLGMFGQNIRPWIIKVFLGTEAVGLYGLATGMYQHAASLFSISRVVGPIIPRYIEKKESLYRLINTAIKYQLLVLTLSATVATLIFFVLINTFFPAYAEAYPLYLYLLPVLIPAGFSSIFEPTFHALKEQKNLFFAAILRLSLIVLVLPVAILLFGFYGIALEFFITRAVYSVNRYLKLRTLLPDYIFKFKDIMTFTEMDRLLLQKILGRLQKINPLSKPML